MLGLEIEAAEVSVAPPPARGLREICCFGFILQMNMEAVDSARRLPVVLLCTAAVLWNTPGNLGCGSSLSLSPLFTPV